MFVAVNENTLAKTVFFPRFIVGYGVDLSDPSTFVNQENKALTFDNCGNYATVEEIFDKINTASPDTFTLVNGSIKLK